MEEDEIVLYLRLFGGKFEVLSFGNVCVVSLLVWKFNENEKHLYVEVCSL